MLDNNDYFSLFDFKPTFDIDEDVLEKKWLELSNLIHPDRYASSNKIDQLASVKLMAFVNNAYYNLLDPVKRAKYICELNGIMIDNNVSFSDSNFLIKQIEWRENLDCMLNKKDFALLNNFISTIKEEKNKRFELLFLLLDKKHDYINASVLVRELMFIDKILQESTDLYDQL